MLIVLSEASDQLPPSASRSAIAVSTQIARLQGLPVYSIPQDFSRCETAENALGHVPVPARSTPGIWLGYIPTPERYLEMYEAALQKNIVLLNSPAQHLRAQEFDRAYDRLHRLQGLTPASVIVRTVEDCQRAIEQLGLPVFVKGCVQSRKATGWNACVATTIEEVQRLTQQFLIEFTARSRDRVVLRQLVKLRHVQTAPNGFPYGREYRVFLYEQAVISYGYYWGVDDPLRWLTTPEEEEIFAIAREAARQLEVPFVAIDVGQLESGDWIVIETGDGQFSGLSQIPPIQFWNELRQVLER